MTSTMDSASTGLALRRLRAVGPDGSRLVSLHVFRCRSQRSNPSFTKGAAPGSGTVASAPASPEPAAYDTSTAGDPYDAFESSPESPLGAPEVAKAS
eukprot:CAMPEP_0196770734 /NCGR_PEP_ID=MMETSP1104-20130614/1305_1 /TAXON_ID=33652 /ORGANISM="Cafeteria sp., Strain Caron Lab Isolate" /LENGTH=96 /DNA_ID=CAMNT_0042140849 /DNA_START=157 /DNA_END=443 /DNA_ORIENTATION=-